MREHDLCELLIRREPNLLFLDFDGTLVRHVSTPDRAWPTPQLIHTLAGLCNTSNEVCILSGRQLTDVAARFAGIRGLWMVGSHGAEILTPKRRVFRTRRTPTRLRPVRSLRSRVVELAVANPGTFVERKPFGFALHYRNASTAVGAALQERVGYLWKDHALKSHEILFGDKVVEFRPRGIDKGTAVTAIMRAYRAANLHPVCIGNDVTDADAFRVVERLGATVQVGAAAALAHAHYRLQNPRQVRYLLKALLSSAIDKEKVQ